MSTPLPELPHDHIYEWSLEFEDKFGDKAIYEAAKLAGYNRIPPTIEEFMTEKYYLGEIGKDLYPFWREQLRLIYPSPFWSPYLEIAASGPIGIGKTSIILFGLLYDLARLLCLADPHTKYGLMGEAPIVIAFINTTARLADDVLYNQFRDWMLSSKFFREFVTFENKRKWRLHHNIQLVRGSRMGHVLGRNVIMATLSELNFQGEHQKNQAYKNYTAVKRRMESRYGRGGNYIAPGRLWLDSSRTDEAGFLEQHLKNLYAHPENSLVMCAPAWEILGEAGKNVYSGRTFKVYVGDAAHPPRILDTVDRKTLDVIARGSTEGLPDNQVIDVPVEHYQVFEIDLWGSIRDIAGVAIWGAHKFMPHLYLIDAALSLPHETNDVIELEFQDDSDRLINHLRRNDGSLIGLRPGVEYYMHYDLAIVGRAGISFTCNEGNMPIKRASKDGIEFDVKEDCVYRTDLVICLGAKPGSEIPLTRLGSLIKDLGDAGITIVGVSADQFQSTQIIQTAKGLNIPAEVISTVKTKEPYGVLRTAMNEGRWMAPNHPVLKHELQNLVDTGKEIDYPKIPNQEDGSVGGLNTEQFSKDVADSCAGSIYNCFLKTAIRTKGQEALENWINSMSKAKGEVSLEDQLMELAKKQKSQGFGMWGF